MRPATFLLLLVLLLLGSPAVAAADASYAPRLVVVTNVTELAATVSWVPGEQIAEAYNVYGLPTNGSPVLLGTFTPTSPENAPSSLAVAPGFDAYAVTGIVDGIESPMTTATAADDPCIEIGHDYVIIRCIPVVRKPVMMNRPGVGN